MKIAIDASRYLHEKATGVEWYSWNIINGLRDLLQDQELILYGREEIPGLPVRMIKKKRLWTLLGLSAAIRRDKPDVLFVPSHVLPLSLPRRTVITIHDVAFKHLRSSYSLAQYTYLEWSTRRAVRKADRIIVPSEATAVDLERFYRCDREKIAVIAHGFNPAEKVDASLFESSPVLKHFGVSPGMKYFLYVGRLESKKNLERLVQAFTGFEDKDFRLILAGKRGHGFKRVFAKVQELGLIDRVIMPGYITEEEKAVLLEHCQAFVFPSLYEGFGLPILEAFSYGKPVLTANVSSMPEVGGEAACYVDPLDVDSIKEGLAKVLLVDGEKGRERLKEFSWERAEEETMEILLEKM